MPSSYGAMPGNVVVYDGGKQISGLTVSISMPIGTTGGTGSTGSNRNDGLDRRHGRYRLTGATANMPTRTISPTFAGPSVSRSG